MSRVDNELAASHCARTVATRTRMGDPIGVKEAQTTATALAKRLPLATRKTADLKGLTGWRW